MSAAMMARCASQAALKSGGRSTSRASHFLGELLERAARLGVGFLPHRRAHESKARRQRRRLADGGAEIRRGVRPRVGVGRIVAGEHVEDQRQVIERTREGADMVERARQHQRAGARDQAVARLDGEHAAERARADDRAVGLRADGERHHAGGDRRGRARGRTAGRVVRVARIARLARMEIGELGRHRLADDDRAGVAQLAHGGGVGVGLAAGQNGRAAFGRIILGVEDILDRDRDAVQRAERPPLPFVAVERARLLAARARGRDERRPARRPRRRRCARGRRASAPRPTAGRARSRRRLRWP